jgi:RND family efflux transporter MFP subunit
MKKALIVLILLAAAGAAFWFFNPAKTHDVKAVRAVHAPAVQAVYATGTVEASLMIPIAPKIAARLMTLNVDEGSQVKAGEILAQLEDTDLQQAVVDAQAKLDLAGKDLARAQKLGRTGAISKEALDQAQATSDSAKAALERAKAELGYLQLVAPQDGTIIRRDGEIGELITTGTPVFWINGGDNIRIETEVDEEDVGLVKPGQKVLISADAFPGQIFNGHVISITPKGDPVARSYRVRVGFDGNAPLMIGMTAETNIITQEKDSVILVPLTAVKDGKIIKVTGGKAQEIAVKTDIKTPQAIEITEGISEGDTVIQSYDTSLVAKGRVNAKTSAWSPDKP